MEARATVGAMLRRPFRRLIMYHGLEYIEDKGWLDSLFVIRGDAASLLRFQKHWRSLDN